MLFTSPTFLFFFLPAALALYFAARRPRLKIVALVALSLAFYAWGQPWPALAMVGSIGFTYLVAILIDRQTGTRRKLALALAVTVNLAILLLFRYAPVAAPGLNGLSAPAALNFGPPGLLLPLGVGVFTFHAISYAIEVYRGRVPANRRLSEIALYLGFFPVLAAGPVLRYPALAGQLARRRHSLGRFSAGLRIFVIGLAQKLLLADQLAPLANALFDHAGRPSLAEAWLGTFAYALQVYFDFVGYANMAIGLAVALGFSLPRNFNLPYRARSITEFWLRWEITLSGWFREYVGAPLSGGEGRAWRTYGAIALVAVMIGLWHGASWTLAAWGLWHGLLAMVERAGLKRQLERLWPTVGWAYAMAAVMAGWVLFRAPSLAAAGAVWRGMIGLNGAGPLGQTLSASIGLPQILTLALATILAVQPFASRRGQGAGPVRRLRAKLRARFRAMGPAATLADAGVMALFLFLAALVISGGSYSPFLSLRF